MSHHHSAQDVIHRLSRAIGPLQAVKRMVEEDEDCYQILIQLSSAKFAVNNTGKVILKDHINHCVEDAVAKAIEQFMK